MSDFIKNVKGLALTGWTSYVLIALTLIGLLFVTAYLSKMWVKSTANTLTDGFEIKVQTLECKIAGSKEKIDFINQQRQTIASFANEHRDTAVEFYGFFYATFVIFSLFGLIAAISLAVITKSGISTASPHLIAVFLVSTGIVLLYQGFFGVFQQKVNIDNNAKLSISYAKLADQIDTYCTTGKLNVREPLTAFEDALPKNQPKPTPKSTPTPAGNANSSSANTQPEETTVPKTDAPSKITAFYVNLEPDEFINYIEWQMEYLKAFSIILDDTKISGIDNKKLMPF